MKMDIWICARLRFPRLTGMLTAAAQFLTVNAPTAAASFGCRR